jgi:hypothetical protein
MLWFMLGFLVYSFARTHSQRLLVLHQIANERNKKRWSFPKLGKMSHNAHNTQWATNNIGRAATNPATGIPTNAGPQNGDVFRLFETVTERPQQQLPEWLQVSERETPAQQQQDNRNWYENGHRQHLSQRNQALARANEEVVMQSIIHRPPRRSGDPSHQLQQFGLLRLPRPQQPNEEEDDAFAHEFSWDRINGLQQEPPAAPLR